MLNPHFQFSDFLPCTKASQHTQLIVCMFTKYFRAYIPDQQWFLVSNLQSLKEHTVRSLYLFPGPGGVGLACRVNSILEFSEVHEGGGQTSKVGDVVEKQLGSFVHLFFIAPLSNLGREGRRKGGREGGREKR